MTKIENGVTGVEKGIIALIDSLPISRNRAIVKLRFGLARKQPHTLEQIGRNYNLTRERIRQVEVDSLQKMRKLNRIKELRPAFEKLDECFKNCGDVALEDHLINQLGASRPVALFLLALGEPYVMRPENNHYLSHWGVRADSLVKIDNIIENFLNFFEKSSRPVPRLEVFSRIPSGVSERALISYFNITKLIASNPFDEFGLISWPEIKPRGVKDKAFLVLRRENRPLHFREVTEYINSIDFRDGREAQPQTVHNELIKDPRFIWVERGVYALSDNK